MIALTNKIAFETALAEIVDVPSDEFKHPFQSIAKIVLADDKPNKNNQGIEAEDFDQVAATALHMPVKMNLSKRGGLKNHLGAIPIGVIKSTEKATLPDGTTQLIANAILWNDEYPEEIDYLKKAHAAAKDDPTQVPTVSYELAYSDSITKDGVQWLKKPITLGTAFVKTPAYGSRTSLLALASSGEISMSDLAKELLLLAKAEDETLNEGGNSVDEKELKALQEKLENTEKDLELARAEASTKNETITSLQEQLNQKDEAIKTLTEEKSSLVKAQLIDTRVRKLGEIGVALEADAEKAAKKKEFWASLSEEAFDEYVSDLQAARKASSTPNRIALASVSAPAVPRPSGDSTTVNPQNLLQAMKNLGRN